MKNPKLIAKPFAKNGQKNVIPENYETSMDSNQATWDQGFGQITMLPVAAGGLPPKGQDFNGILNQISESIVFQSQGGRFKFSPEYAESIGGYPKGAILQSDDEKKEYQSLIDNNKVNFNTTSNISASWELVGSKYAIKAEVDLALLKKFDKENISGILGNDQSKVPSLGLLTTEVGKLQPKGNYQPAGDYATNTALTTGLAGKQPVGDYATNTALTNGLGQKLNTSSVVQSTGTSKTQVMSQDAVTKTFLKPGDFGLGSIMGEAIPNNDYNDIKKSGFYAGIGGGNGNNIPPQTSQGSPRYGAVLAAFRNQLEGFLLIAHHQEIMLRTFESGAWQEYISLLTDKNTKIDRNGYLRSSSSVIEIEGVPIGSSVLWNTSAPIPDNFWPNEGRSFSASAYPELAKIYPSLKLPDDRGYAIRVADNGRGKDPGRTVGTYQEDQIQNITGSFGSPTTEGGSSSSGAFSHTVSSGGRAAGTGGNSIKFDFDAGRSVRAGDETRMKNVSKILITRVK
ncbi:hypothetical protein [Providencia rustigianii]|uniref:hypothetical protein n=1 Tax=Providencia rustigianii TaxID=158850 RepID=UPI0038B3C92E